MTHRLLFICHGNICRSPMAEYIMKELVKRRGLEGDFFIASKATSGEEIGNPVYPPVKKLLAKRGIDCSEKHAEQLSYRDYADFDMLIGMESFNISNMQRIVGNDPDGKLFRLLDFTDRPGDIDDPWYTRDFISAERDIERGCEALLERLLRE